MIVFNYSWHNNLFRRSYFKKLFGASKLCKFCRKANSFSLYYQQTLELEFLKMPFTIISKNVKYIVIIVNKNA